MVFSAAFLTAFVVFVVLVVCVLLLLLAVCACFELGLLADGFSSFSLELYRLPIFSTVTSLISLFCFEVIFAGTLTFCLLYTGGLTFDFS